MCGIFSLCSVESHKLTLNYFPKAPFSLDSYTCRASNDTRSDGPEVPLKFGSPYLIYFCY